MFVDPVSKSSNMLTAIRAPSKLFLQATWRRTLIQFCWAKNGAESVLQLYFVKSTKVFHSSFYRQLKTAQPHLDESRFINIIMK